MPTDEHTEETEQIVVFRCKVCGKTKLNIGSMHAHIERHQGFGPFNIIPNLLKIGNFDALQEKTEVIVADDYDVIDAGPTEVDRYV